MLSRLRHLSNHIELIWVKGNHDPSDSTISHLIGANYLEEYYAWEGKLCVHGDKWDDFIVDHPTLTLIVDWFYLWIQKLSPLIAIKVKRNSKTYVHCLEKVRVGSSKLGLKLKSKTVFLGHTHHSEDVMVNGIRLINTGCWTETKNHYALINVESGEICLKEKI